MSGYPHRSLGYRASYYNNLFATISLAWSLRRNQILALPNGLENYLRFCPSRYPFFARISYRRSLHAASNYLKFDNRYLALDP